ncbi:MAG: ABC transporter substrate-binding protein, partial [Chloroflexi bacterium]|nr:ABC transporter substrate-binding protein [Chloroflexota bacterium]
PTPSPKPAAGQPRYGGILNFSHSGDPISYDPVQETGVQSMAPVIPSYSGLVQHSPTEPAKVIGDLAEKWDLSPDGMSYTFHLFKNVKWHDGAPFTSEDARFSLETVRQPPRGVVSPKKEWLKPIDKVEAPDRDTLKVTLGYLSASFLHNLGDGRMVVVPKHVFEAKGNMRRDVVGTGPYRFKAHAAGVSFSVAKNPDYFVKGRPYLDGITWFFIQDAATRFAALRTGRVHMTPANAYGLRPSQSEIVRKELSDKIATYRFPGFVYMAFWMPHNKAPWNDVRVRRAVDLVLDRPKVIDVAVEGVADVGGFLPPGAWSVPQADLMKMPGYRQPKDADIAEAKRLMAEAGYAQGFKSTITSRNRAPTDRSAIAVKDQLAQIGIDFSLKLFEEATTFDVLYKRAFDTAVMTNSGGFDDPDQFLGLYVAGLPRNFSDFSDEIVAKRYEEQARTMDAAKRKEIVLDIQRRMFELIPASVLFWYVFELGVWKDVKDFTPGIGLYNNMKYQDIWLAK